MHGKPKSLWINYLWPIRKEVLLPSALADPCPYWRFNLALLAFVFIAIKETIFLFIVIMSTFIKMSTIIYILTQFLLPLLVVGIANAGIYCKLKVSDLEDIYIILMKCVCVWVFVCQEKWSFSQIAILTDTAPKNPTQQSPRDTKIIISSWGSVRHQKLSLP